MRNQPKYHFFKNTLYALNGMKDLIKNETSFKIELVLALFLLPIIFFLNIDLASKLLMFMVLMGVLITETINSAIERTVDLVTLERRNMAKRAKDMGSAAVFLSIFLFLIVWGSIIFNYFNF
jgi:diacylglycerol kinase (ATP)